MGKNSKRNKNRKDKKCDEAKQKKFEANAVNADLHGKGKHGAAGHSNIGASQSKMENSSNEKQSKNDIHNTFIVEDDEEEHKLDYAGAVIDDYIGMDNTIASYRKKKENSTNEKCTKMLNHKENYGEKEPQCGWSTNGMKTKLHEENIKGSMSNHYQQPNSKEIKMSVVSEVKGDLFGAPTEYSLAHCVAVDMRMGSGIATTFRQMFKRTDDLLAQRKHVGDVAVLYIEKENRFIYYLVTKMLSNGKPKQYDLEKSLVKMKEHIVENNVQKLAMPRIGCGLDRLEWSKVLPMIERIFHDIDIDIVVYDFSQDNLKDTLSNNNANTYKETDEHGESPSTTPITLSSFSKAKNKPDIMPPQQPKEKKMRAQCTSLKTLNSSVTKLHEIALMIREDGIEDEYLNFAKHIASQLRKLSTRSFVTLQGKIQNLISEERLKTLVSPGEN